MNQARYARCLATSRREFDFWHLMIHTPTVKRTRAQRRHVQTRQKRGRLLALEVLTKMNRQLSSVQVDRRTAMSVNPVILDEAHRTKLGAVT